MSRIGGHFGWQGSLGRRRFLVPLRYIWDPLLALSEVGSLALNDRAISQDRNKNSSNSIKLVGVNGWLNLVKYGNCMVIKVEIFEIL